MKVVIDTNCLIASIPRSNPEFWLYRAFKDKQFEWVISNEIMLEYEEKLAVFYSVPTADLVLTVLTLASNVVFAEPFLKWNLIAADPDDNKFADLAISSNANYLVTNDRHFQVLKNLDFPTVKAVTLEEFKNIIGY
jgi:putative PIN family toxin of toxin-antitoxin system